MLPYSVVEPELGDITGNFDIGLMFSGEGIVGAGAGDEDGGATSKSQKPVLKSWVLNHLSSLVHEEGVVFARDAVIVDTFT